MISLHRTSVRKMSFQELNNFAQNGKKIIGAALNYMDIVKARNVPIPEKPLVFLKPTTSYLQEGQTIILPKHFTTINHEVELGVVIGKTGKNISRSDALQYVGGYCLALDLTAMCNLNVARSNGEPWTIGKGFDTSTPVSRLISPTEIDPCNVPLWLKVNGQMRHEGNTKDLIFDVPYLIEYISKYMTLEANDLILTGTPNGAASLQPGDSIESGLGNIVQMKFCVESEK